MVGSLLARGMIVGLLGGLLVFAFASAFGEPQVERAIAIETQMDQAKGEAPEPELVSRQVQRTFGLLTGTVVYGSALGGLFALVFAYAIGRVGRIGPRSLSALLAAAGFIAITVVPGIKYPANPPSIGDPDTIAQRTELYFLMIVVSVAAMVATVTIGRRLLRPRGIWNAALMAGAAYIVVIAVIQMALPDVNEVPDGFPAVLLWRFRMASLGMQLVLWSSIGLMFGAWTEKTLGFRR